MNTTKTMMASLSLILLLLGKTNTVWAADSAVPTDFATIQAAIDDAATMPGDTITVLAGTHAESNIQVTKSVTIAGQGIGTTIIQPGTGPIGFRPLADGVTLKDMTIENFSQAIRFELVGGTIDGTTLYRLLLLNNLRGLEVHNATTMTNLMVEKSNFESTGFGLRVSSSGHLNGVKFLESTFLNNVIGIYEANNGGSSTMKDLEVKNCTFTNHSSSAIFLEEIQDALIEGNNFVNNFRDIQIFKWYQASLPVSNVLIQKNTMTGTKSAIFAIFNAHHTSGQTTFNGVTFTGNAATIDPALAFNGSAVYTGAHSNFQNATPSDGGLGWDTVEV
jgi:hypothetical protein